MSKKQARKQAARIEAARKAAEVCLLPPTPPP
eukprot:COSAG05_NODE_13026_length_444_cov_1.321739_1_plen_31_part_10